jgi:hypothetical protein
MAKSPRRTGKTSKKIPNRQFIDDPDKLLKAILKAVGSLEPGEGLEIRRVRDPDTAPKKSAKKSAKKKSQRRKSPPAKARP